jgi:DNA mismatch repair protein MutL
VLLHALSSAYYNLMPAGCFPFALLFVNCDPEQVDVNVHPAKTEVRFHHQSAVHDFVRDAIRTRLMESRPAPAFSVAPSPQLAARMPFSEFSQAIADAVIPSPLAEPAAVVELPTFALRPEPGPSPRFDFVEAALPPAAPPQRTARLKVPDTHGEFPEGALPQTTGSLTSLSDLRPLGQLHNSFILAVGRDGLWIIDQHVAHERILFEKVLRQMAAGRVEVQRLLMPVVLQLTAEQQIEYARIAGDLEAAGFETEPFGNRTIAVKSAPAAVPASCLEQVIFEILEIAEGEMRAVGLEDFRRGMAATIACRAAIKINMPLDATKMEWMIRELAATDYPMACPHGRPIALKYSTHEILKAFHRI